MYFSQLTSYEKTQLKYKLHQSAYRYFLRSILHILLKHLCIHLIAKENIAVYCHTNKKKKVLVLILGHNADKNNNLRTSILSTKLANSTQSKY